MSTAADDVTPLRLHVRLSHLNFRTAHGLETRPHAFVMGTWPGARYSRGPFALATSGSGDSGAQEVTIELPSSPPAAAVADGSATLWFSLYADSRWAMVPEIDVKDAAYRTVRIEAGEGSLSVRDLVLAQHAATANGSAEVALLDTMIMGDSEGRVKMRMSKGNPEVFADAGKVLGQKGLLAAVDELVNVSHKATLNVMLHPADRGRLTASASARALTRTTLALPSPQTPAFATLQQRLFALVENLYLIQATDVKVADMQGLTRWPRPPAEPLVEHLHLLQFQTPTGPRLPITYVMQTAGARPGVIDARDPERALSRATVERIVNVLHRLLGSAMVTYGMTPDDFTRVGDTQVARRDDTLDARYLTVIAVASFPHTYVANQVHYKADYAVPNVAWLARQPVDVQKTYLGDEAVAALATEAGAGAGAPAPMSAHVHASTYARAHALVQSNRLATMLNARATRVGAPRTQASASALTAPPHVRSQWTAALQASIPEARARSHAHSPAHAQARVAQWIAAMPVTPEEEALQAQKAAMAREPVMVGDRWSYTTGAQQQSSDDCEGVAALTVATARQFREALDRAEELGVPLPPVVRTYRAVMATMTLHFVGGTVTSPFVETSASAPGAAPTKPVHIQLPEIGSPVDAKWDENGHGLVLMETWARACARYLSGVRLNGHHPEDAARDTAILEKAVAADGRAWLHRVPVAYCEGTGAVHPFTMPPRTTYRGLVNGDVHARKGETRMDFARAIKARGFLSADPVTSPTHVAELTTVAEFVRIQAQSYEKNEFTSETQRTHPFLRTLTHFINLDVYERVNPTLGHTLSVHNQTGCRSVTVGDYFLRPEQTSLRSYLSKTVSRREWRDVAEPAIAAALVHTPLASHMGLDARQCPDPARLAHPLPTAALARLASPAVTPATVGVALGQCQPLDGAFMAREPATMAALDVITGCDARPDRVTLPLFIDADKLNYLGVEKTAAFLGALDTLKRDGKIVDYVFLHDQPLSVCADTIQLVLALPCP